MSKKLTYKLLMLLLLGLVILPAKGQRKDMVLDKDWYTVVSDSGDSVPSADQAWQQISVPHTWDKYDGYRQLKHGNRHGVAWYRTSIKPGKENRGRRLFLWFEGVSSFATVWVNDRKVGTHAGGRTTFTIDITDAVKLENTNTVLVKAAHPSFIRTLPWVCGGCSEEQGFSEGSQPMGIFRPVHFISTAQVRVEPFGIHIWNDSNVTAEKAILHSATEIKNYTQKEQIVSVNTTIKDPAGRVVSVFSESCTFKPGQTQIIKYTTPALTRPHLWSPSTPSLYTAITKIVHNGKTEDEVKTSFGIRSVKWNVENGKRQLLINGRRYFLNGTAEYEHLLGNSHAFTATEIKARAMQVRAAGFNAFRDAHQPHNLRYQHYWDSLGVLWWPQFAAHIWFDLPEFRDNFKMLLRDWVKERRNSPSIILWGLENESTLPEDFARECSDIIRQLDPGASSQRLITTCNGGTGTDWNVPQNWTGTYGGNPAEYGADLIKQELVGEYGAWRSIDWHTEGFFDQKGPLSEDRMTQLMEMKVRLADSVKDKTAGHFHWLLYSHDNPGRVQPDEGYRYIDKLGPVNNKGLFTIWGEPTDAFYMFRANYASPATDPMVYIVSHTWPQRFIKPGIKQDLTVYSNCDEVELFNDNHSYGKRKRGKTGTHFEWSGVPVKYNVLYARGYFKGKLAAEDRIVLNHLPAGAAKPVINAVNNTLPAAGYKYLYRVNCGGDEYRDVNGNTWNADLYFTDSAHAGSVSWSNAFPGVSPVQASQRRTFDLIKGTRDQLLFQQYRYGREYLQYYFPVRDGEYLVELYFTEPWYGIGGGMDCREWRVFDVAVNCETVIKGLDIWKEAGTNTALKKTVRVKIKGGAMVVNFPFISSGQAVISAIAIASSHYADTFHVSKPVLPPGWSARHWLDKGDMLFSGSNAHINYLPPLLYGDSWIRTSATPTDTFWSPPANKAREVYIAVDENDNSRLPLWLSKYTQVSDSLVSDANGGTVFRLYKKYLPADSVLVLGKSVKPYTVILHYPTAYELSEKIKRPVIVYPARDTTVLIKDTISWKITVGVGDIYELRFRYKTGNSKQIPAWLMVKASDGTIMRHDKIFFAGADTKWKTLYSSTGTSINAGEYTISIIPANDSELYMDKLEVQ